MDGWMNEFMRECMKMGFGPCAGDGRDALRKLFAIPLGLALPVVLAFYACVQGWLCMRIPLWSHTSLNRNTLNPKP